MLIIYFPLGIILLHHRLYLFSWHHLKPCCPSFFFFKLYFHLASVILNTDGFAPVILNYLENVWMTFSFCIPLKDRRSVPMASSTLSDSPILVHILLPTCVLNLEEWGRGKEIRYLNIIKEDIYWSYAFYYLPFS